MKKVFFTAILILMTGFSFAQKAVIKKEKGVFTQTENSSKTKFQLMATPDELKNIKDQATQFADRLEFKTKAAGSNLYDCELTITNNNTPEYVHKMFLVFGIKSVIFDGKPKTLNELPGLLTSLL